MYISVARIIKCRLGVLNIGSVHAMIKLILILIIFSKDKYVIQGGAEKG